MPPADRSAAPLTRLDLRGADAASGLPRPPAPGEGPVEAVAEIVAAVRAGGDDAVRDLTARFDGVAIDELRVLPDMVASSVAAVDPEVVAALRAAHDRVAAFHRTQAADGHRHELDGIVVDERIIPVDRAGLYVPGGRAAYPSTVLMTAVPALVAGVGEVVLCVPPGPDGTPPPVTLAAAAVAGVSDVYRIGGAQAIAALAFGTESVPAVDVIAGPGNAFVAEAKRQVAGRVGIAAAFAGPSEVVVVADGSTDPTWAAIDVVVQAEHGPDGLAWLVTWDEEVADAVEAAIADEVAASPRAGDIAATLATSGYSVLVDGPTQAAEVVNLVAPEHLELLVTDPDVVLAGVRHAGAVFAGPWAPASVGDYVAGPSHVLPTSGTARFASALSVSDFQKRMHVISLDQGALERVGPVVAALADAEGLPAHAASVRRRMGR